jgi:adenosine deaminase
LESRADLAVTQLDWASAKGDAMDRDELDGRLAAMPKVELHVHLEGSADAETVWEIAARNRVRLPAASLEEWRQFYEFRDFNHFVEVYVAAAGALRTPEDWSFLAERFARNQSLLNVRYTEAFLSASLQVTKFPADEWFHALAEGAAAGEKRYGARVRFIPDISREIPDSRHGVLDFVLRAHPTGSVIGLGLGGPEVGFPPEGYADVYAEARRRRLRVVAHAGETAGPASVRGAVEALGAERIGHGVRCLEDAALVDELRGRRIPLEVSPTSNYCLGVVRRGEPHPLRRMVDAGLFCTVNSDDPPMFGTDLVAEYRLLAGQGFTWEELWRLNRNAVEASFLGEAEKAELRREWAAFEERS